MIHPKIVARVSMKYDIDTNFDAGYLQQFGQRIDSLACAAEDVLLDLSNVTFIDSTGIGALVALHKKLAARGHRLKISGLRGQPLQLFINLKLVPLFCA
jgi:anti-sigma B factor antagonist